MTPGMMMLGFPLVFQSLCKTLLVRLYGGMNLLIIHLPDDVPDLQGR